MPACTSTAWSSRGVFEPAPAGGVIFRGTTGLDANAIAQVQAQARLRLLRSFVRRGLLAGDDVRGLIACCVTAPSHRSPWNGDANSTLSEPIC